MEKMLFEKRASELAPDLLGKKLCKEGCEAIITETEAYEGKNDKASHAHTLTPRSKLMRESHGHWYVYFIYGNHYCLNITCGKEAGAVLIREALPIKGIEGMKRRRGKEKISELCSGPGKLCEAFGITKKFNGKKEGSELRIEEGMVKVRMERLPRIGISKEKEKNWRFRIKQKPQNLEQEP